LINQTIYLTVFEGFKAICKI